MSRNPVLDGPKKAPATIRLEIRRKYNGQQRRSSKAA